MFKLIIRKEDFETKLQALESPDSDKRAKSYTKTKIGSEIAIRKEPRKIRQKRKTMNRLIVINLIKKKNIKIINK